MAWAPAAMAAVSLLSQAFGRHSSRWSGEKEKVEKLPTLASWQKRQLKDILKHPEHLGMAENQPAYQQGSDFLSRILTQDPEMMRQFEAPMMRQFNEEIVPGLAERFSSMGARSSSAFNQAMGQAGQSLSERIAALRANLGLGAAQEAFGYAQLPFAQNMQRLGLGIGTPTFGYHVKGATPGIGTGFSQAMMQGAGQGFGNLIGSMGSSGSTGFPSRATWSNR